MNQAAAFNDFFTRELEKLNISQRAAVEQLEGPVLVIAGPGTGKTQILAARIGKILSSPETQTNPSNILCLTYTDAGTIAMRKRLFSFIGPDAYKVHIYTFHAFCNNVIQDNPELFGIRQLDPVSELEQFGILQKLVDSFPADHPLKRFTGDIYYESKRRLRPLFSLMKTENWSPEFISEKIDEYLNDLPLRDEFIYKSSNSKAGFKKGDVNTKKIEAVREKMENLRAAAFELPNYQKMMAEKGRYDYDDMILWVLNAFKNNQELLLNYQEQYLYFLVDEFQDTNGAQSSILKLLLDYWERPNVFVVGDDDQSIYRFQGANVENILNFATDYPEVKTIMMTDNYRSSQNILNFAAKSIEINQERLVKKLQGLNKELRACNPHYAGLDNVPELREYYNTIHETVGIATEIEALHKEGYDLSEIAIIYRNHKQAEEIAVYLDKKGIPLNIRKKTDILETPFIQKILNILQYLSDESQKPHSREDLLFEIMHYDFFSIDPLFIAGFAVEMKKKTFGNSDRVYWRKELSKVEKKRTVNLFDNNSETIDPVKRLSNDIEYWIGQIHNITTQELFEKIITRGGVLSWMLSNHEKAWLMQSLTCLFDFMKAESMKNPRLKLSDFLNTLQTMKEFGLSLELNRFTYQEKGVNLLTAHSSKGLEFSKVYLIGCTKDCWDKKPNHSGYSMPDNLLGSKTEDDTEESRRLFYVALTRAKEELILSYTTTEQNGKMTERSQFIAELVEYTKTTVQHLNLKDDELFDYLSIVQSSVDKPEMGLLDHDHIDRLLQSYSMSVTHLNNFLRCPLSFYFQNLLKIPAARNEYITFGLAIHFALEKYFRAMLDEPNKNFPLQEKLLGDFRWFMKKNEDSFTAEQYSRRLEYGQKILPGYVDHYLGTWNKIVTLERPLRNIVIEGVPVNGKLDKIEFDGNAVNVVDYKTGKFKNAISKLKGPVDGATREEHGFEKTYGGDYWRQAVFYKLLIDHDPGTKWQMISAEFDFIEPDDKKYCREKIYVSAEDCEVVKLQVKTAFEKIRNHEFAQGCGETDCKWCTFVKHNKRVSFMTPENLLSQEDEGNSPQ